MREKKPSRSLPRRHLFFLLGGIILLSPVSVLGATDYPVGSSLLFGLIFSPLCVCLHELGHACGTVLVGGEVRYIQLGKRFKGEEPWRTRFLGFIWLIYSLPFSGLVMTDIFTVPFYRLRECFLVAAGPFVNLVLLLTGITLSFWAPSASWSVASIGLVMANAIILFYSIPPRTIHLNGALHPNDGLLFYQTLRCKSEEITRRIAASEAFRQIRKAGAEVEGLNLRELLAKQEAEPDNFAVLWRLTYLLSAENDRRYVKILLKLIEHPTLKHDYVPTLLDTYLTWQLGQGPSDQPEIVDHLSARLLTHENTISTRGTRGSILIDIGKIAEGRELLDEVLAKTTSDLDKVYSHVFLALADRQQGDLGSARKHAEMASKLNIACPALARVSGLFNDTGFGVYEVKRSIKT